MAIIELKAAAEGSIVKIRENGQPQEWYVAKQNYRPDLNGPSRVLLVRKDISGKATWSKSGTKCYDTSNVDAILNSEFLARFDASMQDAIATTAISYIAEVERVYTGGATWGAQAVPGTMRRAVFVLDEPEVYGSGNDLLPIAGLLYEATFEGQPLSRWTRRIYAELNDNDTQVVYERAYSIYGSPSDTAFDGGWPVPVSNELGLQPCITVPDTLLVAEDGLLVNNTAPEISGEDGALGTFGDSGPSVSYTVTDANEDAVTVRVTLDGAVVKTHAAALGTAYQYHFPASEWQKIRNGQHTLKISANDGYVTMERTYTFEKAVTSMSFTLAVPLEADGRITKAIESLSGIIPATATLKVEVCNNGFDANPTWEDVTAKVRAGEKFQLSNEVKTAGKWGYNVRVSVSRASPTGDCYINSMGGFFE